MDKFKRQVVGAALSAVFFAAITAPVWAAGLACHTLAVRANDANRPAGHRVKRLKILRIDPKRPLSAQLDQALSDSGLINIQTGNKVATSARLTPSNPAQSGFAGIGAIYPLADSVKDTLAAGGPNLVLDSTNSTPRSQLWIQIEAMSGATYLFDVSLMPVEAPHELITGTTFTVTEAGGITQTDSVPTTRGANLTSHLAFAVTAQFSGLFTVAISSDQLPWDFQECDISTAGSN